jgi:alpha-glucosidase
MLNSIISLKILLLIISWFLISCKDNDQVELQSPDNNVSVVLRAGPNIMFSVSYKGVGVLENSTFSLQFEKLQVLGQNMSIADVKNSIIDETWSPVAGRFKNIRNHCNETVVSLREKESRGREFQLILRAYNDGFAFRYFIPESYRQVLTDPENRDYLLLTDENTIFRFAGDFTAWAADYKSFASHQEAQFNKTTITQVSPEAVIGVPLLVKTGVNKNIYAAITEADLSDFAGMYLAKEEEEGSNTLVTKLSPLVTGNGKVRIKPGTFSPWRVVMVGEGPGKLIESEIVCNLSDPSEIENTSWIRPGISAWDHWWSGDVKMDTRTIKQYIKLAADMGWEYMIIDWHWYGPPFTSGEDYEANPDADITRVNPAVDMPEVLDYANNNKVRLILWLQWEHAEKQMDEAFALYEKWGIAGVKIDFMARDDQDMVNFYERVVKKAAEHKLMVDFHGAYKPTGLRRTYPNLITREGVLGNEYNKWSEQVTPEHNCTLPFTRMLAGPMDYTPGAFINRTAEKFENTIPAQVMTTRCQQLAMFVVFDSPFVVACDHPDQYDNKKGIDFLKVVPTTWDDTKVLSGEVGEHIVMARKNNDRWYIGAMNNSLPRKIEITLEFLDEGGYRLYFFKDGPDANNNAEDIQEGETIVMKTDSIQIDMASGGGYAAYLFPAK